MEANGNSCFLQERIPQICNRPYKHPSSDLLARIYKIHTTAALLDLAWLCKVNFQLTFCDSMYLSCIWAFSSWSRRPLLLPQTSGHDHSSRSHVAPAWPLGGRYLCSWCWRLTGPRSQGRKLISQSLDFILLWLQLVCDDLLPWKQEASFVVSFAWSLRKLNFIWIFLKGNLKVHKSIYNIYSVHVTAL